MKKKYYLFTLSTNLTNGNLYNSTVFSSGNEMPPFSEIVKRNNETITSQGYEAIENTTIILYMAKLTKQEYEALNKTL